MSLLQGFFLNLTAPVSIHFHCMLRSSLSILLKAAIYVLWVKENYKDDKIIFEQTIIKFH